MSERLQKFLARAGVASRRHAEGLITAGRVQVNNQRVTQLGTKVQPGDLVTVDGALVTAPETTSWYLLHKPPGVVTTLADPEGRPTVGELLRQVPGRLFPVGRLDWDAEGALLFTNDGTAAHRLLHPSFEVRRTYLAKVKGNPTDQTLQRLVEGVRLEDGPARALRAERFEAAERNTWLVLEVGEGRPHLVKRLCASVGHPVLRLFRPAQGGVSVAGLGPGEVRPLTAEEVETVQSVAAGAAVPQAALFLPPRRHGRGGDEEEGRVEDTAPAVAPRSAPGHAPRGSTGQRQRAGQGGPGLDRPPRSDPQRRQRAHRVSPHPPRFGPTQRHAFRRGSGGQHPRAGRGFEEDRMPSERGFHRGRGWEGGPSREGHPSRGAGWKKSRGFAGGGSRSPRHVPGRPDAARASSHRPGSPGRAKRGAGGRAFTPRARHGRPFPQSFSALTRGERRGPPGGGRGRRPGRSPPRGGRGGTHPGSPRPQRPRK